MRLSARTKVSLRIHDFGIKATYNQRSQAKGNVETPQTSEVSVPSESLSLSGVPARSGGLFRKAGLALCFAAAMGGLPSPVLAAGLSGADQTVASLSIDNSRESELVAQSGECGQIVNLAPGKDGHGIHLSIHGLGTSPSAMSALDQKAQESGQATSTFAYDDMHCTQADNGASLAKSLKSLVAQHPGENITIETHSLGGRVALTALDLLNQRGELPAQSIKLAMISPPLAGFGLANIALMAPIGLMKLIPGAAPTHDMASMSAAQQKLEGMRLPGNVETSVYYGTKDPLIDYTKYEHDDIHRNLNASVYYIAGGEHSTTVGVVAANVPGTISATHLAYEARPPASDMNNY